MAPIVFNRAYVIENGYTTMNDKSMELLNKSHIRQAYLRYKSNNFYWGLRNE